MDVDGLALSTAITSWGNLALLAPGLTRLAPGEGAPLLGPAARMFLAAGASGGAALGVQTTAAELLGRAGALPFAIGAGVAVYLLTTLLLGVPEARDAARRLTAWRRRSSPPRA